MGTVKNTRSMLVNMTPILRDGTFVFCSTSDLTLAEQAKATALSWFREDEGVALILELGAAASLGFDLEMSMGRIVLEVYSALDGVGLTAAVAEALAFQNIPCNVVSAYHHDNVFVPIAMAVQAFEVLKSVQKRAQEEQG